MNKPNVIIFLTDDQAYGDTSKAGNQNLSTPVIDNLEYNGAKMNSFYTCPVCAPTRAELLTGRQYIKTGVYGVTKKAEYINLDETTIGNVFKAGGYNTACFGKWHSGSLYPYHPNARGFDEFYGFCCGHWGYYFNTTMDHNGVECQGEDYIIDDVTNHCIDYIKEKKDEPFFCYVAYNTPHAPYQVPDKHFDQHKDQQLISRSRTPDKEDDTIVKSVMAMCENIDWNMGRVLETLEDCKILDNTIIVYLSDNGPCGSCRYNSGMLGMKAGVDEGSVRTCCSFTWNNHIKPGTVVDQIGSTTDLMPTLASMCGIDCKTNKELDGIDLSPYILGQTKELTPRKIFALHGHLDNQNKFKYKLSIRNQQYRYIYRRMEQGGIDNELYDMDLDRNQYNNIAQSNLSVVSELKQDCENFLKKYVPTEFDTRYLTIGYKEQPKAYLNAQDGEPNGQITWSSIHPNCSYFINWNDDQDRIIWPVDCHTSGKYRATVMYTCKEESVGNVLTVMSNDDMCAHVIDEAFDPELDENLDRSPRVESYTKAFKPQYIGELYINKGINEIKLTGRKFRTKEVCQVRTLLLELIE